MYIQTIKNITLIGSGWLGLPLGKSLVEEGYNVAATTRSFEKFEELKKHRIQPVIADINSLPVFATQPNADVMIINIPSKNVQGFKVLIDEIEKTGISRIIFVSSTSVYKTNHSPCSEDNPETLDINHPLFKIENIFLSSKQFTTTIIRFGGLIGPGRNPSSFFKKTKVINNPHGFVNLIHLDDCIGIIKEIITQNLWGEIINGCADTHPERKVFYTHVFNTTNKKVPDFIYSAESESKIVLNHKVKSILNYNFKYPDLLKIDYNCL